jgi:hypothetical protein
MKRSGIGLMFRLQMNGTDRHHVVDYHFRVLDDDPVHHQPRRFLLGLNEGFSSASRMLAKNH